mmetsp:Transcript_83824/g.237490  ORF Transcript_83824/g.237490 Transcript_83824/m.237490 type:complete len:159 (+) Transcript_83824:59-535(+)
MGRRRRSPSESSYTEDYSESRSRSRRRHRSRRLRSRRHKHGHRRRHEDRDRRREDRERGRPEERGRRSGGGGRSAVVAGEEGGGGEGDWQHDLKDFIRKNRLDERTQDALFQLAKRDACEVMGTDGGKNSFVLDENVRNPDAVIMSRVRRLGDNRSAV